jgi:hypothetical protein
VERYCSGRDVLVENVANKTGNVSFNWLFMSPIKEKFITYDKLLDGSITLFDIYTMNELICYSIDFDKNLQDEIRNIYGK